MTYDVTRSLQPLISSFPISLSVSPYLQIQWVAKLQKNIKERQSTYSNIMRLRKADLKAEHAGKAK